MAIIKKKICLDKDVEKLEFLYTADGGVKLYNHWKTVWQVLKKLELLYDPVIPNGVYTQKN